MRRIEYADIRALHITESFQCRFPRIAGRRRQNENRPLFSAFLFRPCQQIREEGQRQIFESAGPAVEHFRHGKRFVHRMQRNDLPRREGRAVGFSDKFRQLRFRNLFKETAQYMHRRFLIREVFDLLIRKERFRQFFRHVQSAVFRKPLQQCFRGAHCVSAARASVSHDFPPDLFHQKTFLFTYFSTWLPKEKFFSRAACLFL